MIAPEKSGVWAYIPEQRDFLWVFAGQLARWRHERPTDAQRRELDRLDGQLEHLRAVLSAILELADELQQGTIERVLAKSDLELGLEVLLRMTNGCRRSPLAFLLPHLPLSRGYPRHFIPLFRLRLASGTRAVQNSGHKNMVH